MWIQLIHLLLYHISAQDLTVVIFLFSPKVAQFTWKQLLSTNCKGRVYVFLWKELGLLPKEKHQPNVVFADGKEVFNFDFTIFGTRLCFQWKCVLILVQEVKFPIEMAIYKETITTSTSLWRETGKLFFLSNLCGTYTCAVTNHSGNLVWTKSLRFFLIV